MITFNSKGLETKRIIEKRYLKKKSLLSIRSTIIDYHIMKFRN